MIYEQVVQRASAWRDLNAKVGVVAALRKDDAVRCANLKADDVSIHVEVANSTISQILWLRRTMSNTNAVGQSDSIIICRGALTTVCAILARIGLKDRWRVIHDARGWTTAESRGHHESVVKTIAKSLVERLAFRWADFNTVVSETLLGIALCNGARPARCVVIPPYVESVRYLSKLPPLHLEDPSYSVHVLYVGNSSMPYQQGERIGPLLVEIAKRLPDIRFGWLDSSYAGSTATWLTSNLWHNRASYEQVRDYMLLADIGLLIRAPDDTNAAATPTKAIQYFNARCKIVTSPYPPSIAQLCEITGAGVVVDEFDPEAWSSAIDLIYREKPSEYPNLFFHETSTRQWIALLHRATAVGK